MKKITSLTLAWMFLISSISGIILYLAPPGRVARWSEWRIVGLDKDQWAHLHTVTTLLMLFVVALHLYYNWRPFYSYMKPKVAASLSITRELLISLGVAVLITVGSLLLWPPFAQIVSLGDTLKESWEHKLAAPPYSHAELDTLEQLSQKLKLPLQQSLQRLSDKGIKAEPTQSIETIAKENSVTPALLFSLIKPDAKSTKTSLSEGSGMGKKSLEELCAARGIDLSVALGKLEKMGLQTDGSMSVKAAAEALGVTPLELIGALER
ncbi:MAG: DUF4405 domain-containing protein [Campylobacterales bacterium]|nr:DUF4405 domain-containing protein [Campylobacterales bacterium]